MSRLPDVIQGFYYTFIFLIYDSKCFQGCLEIFPGRVNYFEGCIDF